MENKVVLLDTSILIEYYRKKDKTKSTLFHLAKTYSAFAVSAVTHFEIYTGNPADKLDFWNSFFSTISILPFNAEISIEAANIDTALKKARKQIAIADLFIAATASFHNLPLATLNKKHFERIGKLEVLI
ncbi:MAG: type II toxin-antitoxin system VapC family toxin [Sphingobacteriales bacterium]